MIFFVLFPQASEPSLNFNMSKSASFPIDSLKITNTSPFQDHSSIASIILNMKLLQEKEKVFNYVRKYVPYLFKVLTWLKIFFMSSSL